MSKAFSFSVGFKNHSVNTFLKGSRDNKSDKPIDGSFRVIKYV